MLHLRIVEAEDRDILFKWRNSPGVAEYMYTDHIISPDEHDRWLTGVLESERRNQHWIILMDGRGVGLANLSQVDLVNSRCYWAFYLADSSTRGRGVGSFVEYSVLQYVFEEMKLNKLCAEVFSFNEAVRAMHAKFGFVEEGVLRAHQRKGERFHDVVSLGMLRDEWIARREEVESWLRAKGVL